MREYKRVRKPQIENINIDLLHFDSDGSGSLFSHSQTSKSSAIGLIDTAETFVDQESKRVGSIRLFDLLSDKGGPLFEEQTCRFEVNVALDGVSSQRDLPWVHRAPRRIQRKVERYARVSSLVRSACLQHSRWRATVGTHGTVS